MGVQITHVPPARHQSTSWILLKAARLPPGDNLQITTGLLIFPSAQVKALTCEIKEAMCSGLCPVYAHYCHVAVLPERSELRWK